MANPVISALTYTVTDSTIVAVWTTDISADSNLFAGAKAAIDNGVAASGTSHQCIVTGLSPNTVYSCHVVSGATTGSSSNVTTNPAQNRILVKNALNSAVSSTVGAPQGDTYRSFVSSDNKMYMTQDDGFGFVNGGSGTFYNTQLGVITNESTLAGTNISLANYGAGNASNGTDGPASAAMSNKSTGLFGLNGNLHMFVYRQFPPTYTTNRYANWIKSTDHGATWNNFNDKATFTAAGNPVTPNSPSEPVQFYTNLLGLITPVLYAADDGTLGYNTAGNQIDGGNAYVYMHYYKDAVQVLYLMRTPRIQFDAQTTTAFEYWIGPASPTVSDFTNDANWTATEGSETAILNTGSYWVQTIFVPGINSYVLTTYTNSNSPGTTFLFYSAPTPAGPWTPFFYQQNVTTGSLWYGPFPIHRDVLGNTLTNNIPLRVVYNGESGGGNYTPHLSTLTLRTVTQSALAVPNFVTGGTISSVSSIASANFSSTTGNLLVAAVRVGAAISVVTSVKNAAGISFTSIPTSNGVDGVQQGTQLWYLKNITGNATDNVVATFNTTYTFTSIAVWEISGADAVAPLSYGCNGGTTSNTLTIASSALASATTKEVICVGGGIASVNNTYTTNMAVLDSAGFPSGATALYSAAAHQINSSMSVGIIPSLTGTVTHPATISVASFTAAIPSVFSIAGSAGVAGATVSYTGAATGSVIADASGNYSIPNLYAGAYTITPSFGGYTFSPVNSAQTIVAANITGVNFTASAGSISSASSLQAFRNFIDKKGGAF